MKKIFTYIILFLTSGCAPVIILAQNIDSTAYILQTGDEVELIVVQRKELNGTYQISPGGTIYLPMSGSIKIAGMLVAGAEDSIHAHLSKIYDPISIILKVTSYQSDAFFTILGEVNRPGRYPIKGTLNIVNALGLAEGYTENAKIDRIIIKRGSGIKQATFIINLEEILEGGNRSEIKKLQKDDVVFVPRSSMASVINAFGKLQPFMQFALLATVSFLTLQK